MNVCIYGKGGQKGQIFIADIHWIRTRTGHLLRRVGHVVAEIRGGARVPVESVQQAVPVADLVRRRASKIIPAHVAAGHRPAEHVAPIEDIRVARRRGRHAPGGQAAEAQQCRSSRDARGVGGGLELRLVVDVQRGVGAAAQGSFHGQVVAVGRPRVVHSPVDPHQAVANRGVRICPREVVELIRDHRVGHVGG